MMNDAYTNINPYAKCGHKAFEWRCWTCVMAKIALHNNEGMRPTSEEVSEITGLYPEPDDEIVAVQYNMGNRRPQH